MPPSQKPPDEAMDGELAFGVPFKRTNSSNLFQGEPFDIYGFSCNQDQINVTFLMWKIKGDILTDSSNTPAGSRLITTSIWDTSKVIENYNYLVSYMPCFGIKKETIRIWFKDRMAVVWSCNEISKSEHDEAVLVLSFREKMYGTEIENLILDLKIFSRMYLSGSRVLDEIDWDWPRNRGPKYNSVISCSQEYKLSPSLRYIFIGIFAILILVVFVLYLEDIVNICKKKKISP